MSVKRKAERDRQTRMYCESIEIPRVRQKLIVALRDVAGIKNRTTLFELMMKKYLKRMGRGLL